MPRKYSVEFKEKAVHQIIEMVRLESCSLQRAYTEVGELLGVSHHTLRAWYRDSASVRDNSDDAYRCAAHKGPGTCANNCRTNLRRPAGVPQRSGQSVGVIEVFRALANSGIRPNIETAGDTYDHALVETANGLYKAELIHAQDP